MYLRYLISAGFRWAAPRLRQPRRLVARLTATVALEFLTIPARSSTPQDLSGLLELELFGVEGNTYCAMALEGLLRQASAVIIPALQVRTCGMCAAPALDVPGE